MAIYNYYRSGIDDALPVLLRGVLAGARVPSRNGLTSELTQIGLTLTRPLDREITLPGRKANIAAQIAETAWMLAGRDDIEWLSHYLPRAKDYSDDGVVWRGAYGPRLRGTLNSVDQLAYVVKLLREDPDTRRAVINIYDAQEDSTGEPTKDTPCNDFLMFLARDGKLDLHVTIRSNDLMWGWSGINQFEWSVLLEVVAGLASLKVGSLHFSIASLHLYEKHWDKARKIEIEGNLTATSSPRFEGHRIEVAGLDNMLKHWFLIEERIRTGRAHINDVDNFPEPMLQSWLRVLQWWWSGDENYLSPLAGTRLTVACRVGMQPRTVEPTRQKFVDYVIDLHNEKHKAYGDSWKRRGEMLGIMANIARKIDRLGVDGAGDSALDTAVDLLVYLAKYRDWLDHPKATTTHDANEIIVAESLRDLDIKASIPYLENSLTDLFADLERCVEDRNEAGKLGVLSAMLPTAYKMASELYRAQG